MPGRIDVEFLLGAEPGNRRGRAQRDGTRLLILGDFSGAGQRTPALQRYPASRPAIRIDVDNFDAVFRHLAPGVLLGSVADAATALQIRFEGLDDFHPDRLYRSLDLFRPLRESRERLLNPATFEHEAARLVQDRPAPEAATATAEDQAQLLERLLGAPSGSRATPAPTAIDELVRRLVRPYVVHVSTESAAPYLEALDASATELMRAILHDPRFQALESTWRGVRRLVDTLDLDEDLQLHLVDVGKEQLAEELARDRRLGEEPWSLLAGLYSFGANAADLDLLAKTGDAAGRMGARFLAAADSSLLGCPELDAKTDPREWSIRDEDIGKRWTELRASPAARWIGLALPRVLVRQPYGPGSDPTEAFDFEEISPAGRHEEYLWGNPAVACVQVIARAFRAQEEDPSIAPPLDVDDLPTFVRHRDGDRELLPCGEHYLGIGVGEQIFRRGFIPILSYANRNAVRVAGLRTIAA